MQDAGDEAEESLLFNLAYCSRASAPLQGVDIGDIVAVARRNNARQHITGWLVYSSGIFFQWLEGRRDDVVRVMKIIEKDPRHSAVVVLSESEEIRERLFSEWDMELVSPEDIRAVLADASAESTDPQTTSALQRLMEELDSQKIAS